MYRIRPETFGKSGRPLDGYDYEVKLLLSGVFLHDLKIAQSIENLDFP
ncbi:hypothetical protein [Lachnoclostridium sp.]